MLENDGQVISVGLEFGLPYDIASVLENSMGHTLTVVSLVGVGLVLLVSLVFQMEVPLIIDHKRSRRSTKGKHTMLSLNPGLRILGVKKVPCKKKLVCEVHSLLLSCPVWLHTPLRLITSRVNLNQYRLAAKQGLSGKDCSSIYSSCSTSNFEILFNAWPNITRGRRPY